MIQQKELRVGNYVYVETFGDELHEISTISRHGRDCSVTDSKLGYQSSILDIEAINPIPLSEEILISMGFIHRSSHRGDGAIFDYVFPDGQKGLHVFKEYEQNGGGWHTGHAFGRAKVNHVHILQNVVFFFTGGHELVINQVS